MIDTVRVYAVKKSDEKPATIFVTESNSNLLIPPVPLDCYLDDQEVTEGRYILEMVHDFSHLYQILRTHPLQKDTFVFARRTREDLKREPTSNVPFKIISMTEVPRELFEQKRQEYSNQKEAAMAVRRKIEDTYEKCFRAMEGFRQEELDTVPVPQLSLDELLKKSPRL